MIKARLLYMTSVTCHSRKEVEFVKLASHWTDKIPADPEIVAL